MFFKMTRQPVLFYDSKGGGGGDNDNAENTEEDGEESTPDGKGKKPDDEKERQKEIDRIVGKRAKEAKDSARKELWAALGITSQEEWDTYVKNKKEAEDANKTELQKAKDGENAAKTELEKLKNDHKAEVETMQKRIIDTEIRIAASKQTVDKDGKVIRAAFHPDFIDDVPVLIDRKEIALDEDGKVVGIEKALEALAKSKARMLAEVSNNNTTKKPKGTPAPEGKSRFKTSGSRSNTPEKDDGDDEDPMFSTL